MARFIYIGFQLRVQGRGAYGVRRALAALSCVKTKAARARRTPYAPRRRAAYPFRKGCIGRALNRNSAPVTSRSRFRCIHAYAAAPVLLFAALARFFCLGFGLVLPEVPRDIFPRFER